MGTGLRLKCQNGHDTSTCTALLHIPTGEVKWLCWDCICKLGEVAADGQSLELTHPDYEFWPG